jgi:hypothetical protein
MSPAVSKSQQQFMGMVHAAQTGEKAASPEVAKAAKSMSKKSAKDFASTPQKGLPNHVPGQGMGSGPHGPRAGRRQGKGPMQAKQTPTGNLTKKKF